MFGNFEEEARQILVGAKEEMIELHHPYVSSEHLLLSILKQNNDISGKLKDYDLTYDRFRQEVIEIIGIGEKKSDLFLYTPLLKRILEGAIIDSKENNGGVVTINHLFSSLLEEGEGVAIRIMLGMGINIDKLYDEFSYKIINCTKKKKKLLLDELGVDLTKKARNKELDPVIGRDQEIKRVLEILCRRTKNNPLLIGEAGVGKTAIIEGLANLIVRDNVPISMRGKRIISLDMATMVAGTKYRGEFEERMRKVLKEIEENKDIILFVDEVHTLVGAGGAEGAIDASNIFKPALARGKLRLIGATTIDEYKKFVEPDRALERRFQKVVIEKPSKEVVHDILSNLKEIYEQYHSVKVSDEIIDLIIELSSRYMYERNEPDASIDLLDEVCSAVSLKETKEMKEYHRLTQELNNYVNLKNKAILALEFENAAILKEKENALQNTLNNLSLQMDNIVIPKVTKEDLARVVNIKTGIPVYEIMNMGLDHIKQMTRRLKEKVIGQDKVIDNLVDLAKRIKLGFNDRVTSLLFVGGSGVGKTYLARLFAEELVGKDNVIKLDMSEYNDASSITKLIGSNPGYVGYQEKKHIFDIIRTKPSTVLLLDEIEKAHPSIISLLFQILDEGKVKDSNNRLINFQNVVIIMTSNVGFLNNNVGFTKTESQISYLKEFFGIPFINRIDSIHYFANLDEDKICSIINLKIQGLKEKYKTKGISIKVGYNIIQEILEECKSIDFGARRLDKIMREKIEKKVIDALIESKKQVCIGIRKKVKKEVLSS